MVQIAGDGTPGNGTPGNGITGFGAPQVTGAATGATTTQGIAKSVAAGTAAALIGATGWAIIVSVSGYEVGIAAIGIGFLVGQAMGSTASTSKALPPIGAVLALVGCLLGNAFADAHALGKAVGTSTAHVLHRMVVDPALAGDVFKAGFEVFDVVFWAIAAFQGYKLTALGVARARGERTLEEF